MFSNLSEPHKHFEESSSDEESYENSNGRAFDIGFNFQDDEQSTKKKKQSEEQKNQKKEDDGTDLIRFMNQLSVDDPEKSVKEKGRVLQALHDWDDRMFGYNPNDPNANDATTQNQWIRLQQNQYTIFNAEREESFPYELRYVRDLKVDTRDGLPQNIENLAATHLNYKLHYGRSLDPRITKLSRVKTLEIHGYLYNLPENLSELKKLEELYIYGGSSRNFLWLHDNIGKCQSLREIHIERCGLADLPSGMSKLKNLEILELIDVNLAEIPKWIGQLGQLHTLRIKGKYITSIPYEFWGLINLKTLEIEDCPIKELPPGITKMNKLEKLTLMYTGVVTLPVDFYKLTKLTRLEITGLKFIDDLATVWRLPKLKILLINSTGITYLSSIIKNPPPLITFQFRDNECVSEYPKEWAVLGKIQGLSITKSLFVKTLPQELTDVGWVLDY